MDFNKSTIAVLLILLIGYLAMNNAPSSVGGILMVIAVSAFVLLGVYMLLSAVYDWYKKQK